MRPIPTRLPSSLSEASAVVRSATRPDVLFTINDSGHEPRLFALDTTGSLRGQWRIGDARNRDWEAASSGPCGSPPGPTAGSACLYIGDLGDNGETLRTRTIYRLIEPQVGASATTDALAAQSLTFRYADGPHDVEAMYVGPDGTIYLITKRPLLGRQRRPRPSLVFALDLAAWLRPDSVAVARLIDSLPIVPGSAPGRLVTDAALAPDGRHVAVRTYGEVFVFAADSSSGRIRMDVPPSVCSVMELGERQGEGVTWLDSSGRLLLVSEGRGEPLHVHACPLPPVGGTEADRPAGR